MQLLKILPPRNIPGADEVLNGSRLRCCSGRTVDIWPCMTRSKDGVRIAFYQGWREPPTESEAAEVRQYLTDFMAKATGLKRPVLHLRSDSPNTHDAAEKQAEQWLKTGEIPKVN